MDSSRRAHFDIIQALLGDKPNLINAKQLMEKENIDISIARSIIYIELSFQTNEYFNINLNLGYSPVLNKARQEIMQFMRDNKYFNAQDIYGYLSDNEFVIMKSFLATGDTTKIYKALDYICMNIETGLDAIELLDAKIAYGNLYTSLSELPSSMLEAKSLISIGKAEYTNQHFYAIDKLVFGSICKNLPPQITEKILIPSLAKLSLEYPTSYKELLHTAKVFIDNCMNFSITAEKMGIHRNTLNKRIERIEYTTGLDIKNCFQDALLIKFMDYIANQEHVTIR